MEEALKLRREMPDALLCGERNGDRPDGFDLGNSPFEYRNVAAARLITTTTNGTVALRACGGADEVLVGALLNMERLASHLRETSPQHVLLVCAGTFRDTALEDAIAAGMLCAAFPGVELSDAARMALAIFEKYQAHPADGLRESRNGRVLTAKGRGDELLYCAQNSLHDVIGAMKNGVLRRLHAPTEKLKPATFDVTH
jgi:2-phosphosulfolactate phosphatase